MSSIYDYDDLVTLLQSIKKDLNKIVKEDVGEQKKLPETTIEYEEMYIREKARILQAILDSALIVAQSLDLHTN
jgi:hypothetical protein